MASNQSDYPVQFSVDYPDQPLNRLTTLFRLIMVIPILIVAGLIPGFVNSGQASGSEQAAISIPTRLASPRPDSGFPTQIPALVVRLEPGTQPLRLPHRGLRPRPARRIPLHRRPPGRPPGHRLPRRPGRPQPLAPPRQVVPGHPPLHRAGHPRHPGLHRRHPRLDHGRHHRPVPPRPSSISSSASSATAPRPGLRLHAHHRPLPTLPPRP